jgi:hypothetical protein
MDRRSEEFNLELSNIPLINLRNEFNVHLGLMRRADFRALFTGPRTGPIQTPYLVWLGMPGALLTLFLQRAIAGLEAWVVGAVWWELGVTRRLGKKTIDALMNPGSLQGRGMAEKYYCTLPAMVGPKHSLEVVDPVLCQRNKKFYREVHNPVMHGFEISSKSAEGTAACFNHIYSMYLWIDTWHDPSAWWRVADRKRSVSRRQSDG